MRGKRAARLQIEEATFKETFRDGPITTLSTPHNTSGVVIDEQTDVSRCPLMHRVHVVANNKRAPTREGQSDLTVSSCTGSLTA